MLKVIGVYKIMKCFVILTLALSLLGCGSDSKNSSHNQSLSNDRNLNLDLLDLTGTWTSFREDRVVEISTGEYLLSYYHQKRFVLEETDRGVKHSRCEDYGDFRKNYGVKTSKNFYMHPTDSLDTGFQAIDENTLIQATVSEAEVHPGFRYESTEILTRISNGVVLDSGTLIYNGSINFAEYSHACVDAWSSSSDDYKVLIFSSPYGDGNIDFTFILNGEVVPGDYYEDDDVSSDIVDFYISSSASDATDVGEIDLLHGSTRETTVSVIESNEDRFSGTFSIVDYQDKTHTGEFEILFDR